MCFDIYSAFHFLHIECWFYDFYSAEYIFVRGSGTKYGNGQKDVDLTRLAIVKSDPFKAGIEKEKLQFEYRRFAGKPLLEEKTKLFNKFILKKQEVVAMIELMIWK